MLSSTKECESCICHMFQQVVELFGQQNFLIETSTNVTAAVC